MWFDSHCHLTSLKGDAGDVAASAVKAAVDGGVTRMITVGCTVDDSRRAIETAARFDNVLATVGVHPHDAKDGVVGLTDLLDRSGVVAVGECGLDYHYDHSPRDVQADVFARQIEMANQTGLPLVVHSRKAWDDTFDILDRVGMPQRTIFHCFTGGRDEGRAATERGGYLSFSGIVTFGSADDIRQAARDAPSDRILIETDSPYLAPVPHRGKPNQPANAAVVGQFMAELRGLPVEEFANMSTANTLRAFRLDRRAEAAG
jgi:TatD DNase family protein